MENKKYDFCGLLEKEVYTFAKKDEIVEGEPEFERTSFENRVVDETLYICALHKLPISRMLAHYMLFLSNFDQDTKEYLSAERDETEAARKLVQWCCRKLFSQTCPKMMTIKMQIFFELNYKEREVYIRQHRDKLEGQLAPLVREILKSSTDHTKQAMDCQARNVILFIIRRTGIGSPTNMDSTRETKGTLMNLIPWLELQYLLSLKESCRYLNQVAHLVGGLRLFNHFWVQPAKDFSNYLEILLEAVPSFLNKLKEELNTAQTHSQQFTEVLFMLNKKALLKYSCQELKELLEMESDYMASRGMSRQVPRQERTAADEQSAAKPTTQQCDERLLPLVDQLTSHTTSLTISPSAELLFAHPSQQDWCSLEVNHILKSILINCHQYSNFVQILMEDVQFLLKRVLGLKNLFKKQIFHLHKLQTASIPSPATHLLPTLIDLSLIWLAFQEELTALNSYSLIMKNIKPYFQSSLDLTKYNETIKYLLSSTQELFANQNYSEAMRKVLAQFGLAPAAGVTEACYSKQKEELKLRSPTEPKQPQQEPEPDIFTENFEEKLKRKEEILKTSTFSTVKRNSLINLLYEEEDRLKESTYVSEKPEPYLPVKVLTPESVKNFYSIKLEYQEFCPVTLLEVPGFLLSCQRDVGLALHQGRCYGFAHCRTLERFVVEHCQILEQVELLGEDFPELIYFLCLSRNYILPFSRRCGSQVTSSILVDAQVQTDTHLLPIFTGWKEYSNSWDYRRDAIHLLDIRNKQTHSIQTNRSFFRRDTDCQCSEPRSRATQTMQDVPTQTTRDQLIMTGYYTQRWLGRAAEGTRYRVDYGEDLDLVVEPSKIGYEEQLCMKMEEELKVLKALREKQERELRAALRRRYLCKQHMFKILGIEHTFPELEEIEAKFPDETESFQEIQKCHL